MNRRAIIATHHKTGTVWMARTFKAISENLGLQTTSHKRRGKNAVGLKAPCIIFDKHSQWFSKRSRSVEKTSDDRFLHLRRDPRDVVISAMHYHCVAKEDWLHRPDPEFGGMTYQEKIKSLADDRSKFLFEMDHSAGRVTRHMSLWEARPESFECKYEDLICDTDMTLFSTILTHLGFEESEFGVCRKSFWDNSLFGAITRRADKGHIRSGDARQWPTVFDQELGNEFVKRFDGVLERLGYEEDSSWISRLSH